MKELQAGIELVKTKYIQLERHPFFHNKAKTLDPVTASSEVQAKKRSVLHSASRSQSGEVETQQKQSHTQATSLLPFPIKSSWGKVGRRLTSGMRRMENQAKRINQLSGELEAAVLELKAIASEINPDWRGLQATQKSSSSRTRTGICEYHAIAIPQVELKPDNSFMLISKPIDLFQAEREAMLLAQTLRQRARKKREHKS